MIDLVTDWNPSNELHRRTPTEVFTLVASRIRRDYDYGEHKIVFHNDAAFGGALGADLGAMLGVDVIASTNRSSVHSLVSLLDSRLRLNQYFMFREPRGGYELTYSFRKVTMTLRKKVKLDGNNHIGETNEDRLIVNVSTRRLGRVELNNELRPHQLSDVGVKQLFKLDHTGLFLLAVHYTITMNKDPEDPDSPRSDWTSSRLVSWISRRPLPEIKKISGAPALRKAAAKADQLDEDREAALAPIQQALDHIRAEKEETRGCSYHGCDQTYPINSRRAQGWLFCDKCVRRAVCPQHAARFQDQFERMHEATCDILPTWAELENQEADLKKQKSDVIADFARRRAVGLAAQEQRRFQKPRKELLQEAIQLGLLASNADLKKPELLQLLTRFDSVRNSDLDELILRSFGLPHSTQRERIPGPDKQYREGFNFVDRENRDFYKLTWPYAVRKSDSVFFWNLLTFPLLNSHRWYQEVKVSSHQPGGLRHYIKRILDVGLAAEPE